MDNSTMIVVVMGLFALVVIVGLLIFPRVRAKIKGLWGTGLEIDVSKEPTSPGPAVKVSEAESRSGGVTARDETGRGEIDDPNAEVVRRQFAEWGTEDHK
jgi:hypothetical protein